MEKEAKKQQQRVGCRSEPDFLLQWGNRKRLRCVKIQVKDDATEKTTIRVDRRVVRADKESAVVLLRPSPFVGEHHRLLRNSENSGAMKAQNRVHTPSPEKAEERYPQAKINNSSNNNNNNNNNNININNNNRGGNGGVSVSSETVQEKKGSSGNEAVAWPKFMITLTSKEKEEDFMAIKGSKLPQRPKKRAKFIQRSLNLVSPGSWLCDLTLERYEVREKKISRKRPRGLKAMGNMDSDSE